MPNLIRSQVAEFMRRRGPAREQCMGFEKETLAVIGSLLDAYGYHCKHADPFMVRFESDDAYVLVSQEPDDNQIDVTFGMLSGPLAIRGYSLREILAFLDVSGLQDHTGIPAYAAKDRDEVHTRIGQIAKLLQTYCARAISGDEDFFRELVNGLSALPCDYILSRDRERIKKHADEAWHKGDYAEVWRLYGSMERSTLTKEETDQLDSAREKMKQGNGANGN